MPIDPKKIVWDEPAAPTALTAENVKWDEPAAPTAAGKPMPEWYTKNFSPDNPQVAQASANAQANIDTLFGAVKNTPASALKLASDIYNAIRHPVDTATAVYSTARGGIEKLAPGESKPSEHEQNFDQMVEFFAQRYGGSENLRKTIETDPVGFLADISSVFTGAGGAVRGSAAVASKVGPRAAAVAAPVAKAGRALSEVGAVTDPVSMAVQGAVNAAGKAVPNTGRLSPEAFYESALKPSTTLPKEERTARVATALENSIMPTQQGLDKVSDLISKIDNEVSESINTGPYGGNPINTQTVVGYLDELKEFAKNTVNPQKALADINKVESRFLAAKGTSMSVEAAHNLKKNTYVELKKFYDEFQRSAEIEAKKALARGLKEEVYSLYPELRELGKKEGALIALQESIERAANRISNRDVIGLGVPMKGAAGGIVGGPAGAVATTALGILDTPTVKARLAQALYKARQGVGSMRGTATRAAAFQGGRIEDETD